MLTKGASSVLLQVTAVAGQTVTFAPGDPLNLNQFDTELDMLGTMNQLKAQGPADPDAPVLVAGVIQTGPSLATRVRMITYYVDTALDPTSPRLMRAIGGNAPTRWASARGVPAHLRHRGRRDQSDRRAHGRGRSRR